MSVTALNSVSEYLVKNENLGADEMLEKCGEVFLERQLGNLIYLCTLCSDQFQNVEVFSKHISDVHLSVESYIAYEPNESDGDESEKADDFEELVKIELFDEEQEQINDADLNMSDDDSLMPNEEIFEVIDESEAALNIQFYDETQDEHGILEQLQDDPPLPEVKDEAELTADETSQNHERVDCSDEEILKSKLKCKFCSEQFEYVKHLKQHDCGLGKQKKLHRCSVCGKVFKKKSGLDIHSLIHKGEKPHKCDICGSAYACKQNLIVHIRRHTGEKPFKCDYCERRFASSTERISHMRTHTGERPFVCELCGKGHSSSSQLTEHMHRHLDIRNFQCDLCDKRFRNSYNLRMHRMTHEDGPRKFSCEQCLSTFKTQNNLLQHSKIHQKEKKYVCKICGRAFAQHPGLYSHMKSHSVSK